MLFYPPTHADLTQSFLPWREPSVQEATSAPTECGRNTYQPSGIAKGIEETLALSDFQDVQEFNLV